MRGAKLLDAILRPVAGAAGNLLPGCFVYFLDILVDGEFPAARRAAEGNVLSTDAELDLLATNLALHNNLKKTDDRPQRTDDRKN